MTLSYEELVAHYKSLQEKHEQELKTLECKQKLEKDKLLSKQHAEMQEVKLSDYFKVGDSIAIGKVDYIPAAHYTEAYMVRAVGTDYLVCFSEKFFDNELISWGDLIEAEAIYKNGELVAGKDNVK